MKSKIAIVSGYEQFGYHTDTYNYCLFLKDNFDILFISPDCNLPRISLDGIKVKYLPESRFRILRGGYKLLFPLILIYFYNIDLVFITHFERCSLLKKLLFRKKFVLDIRTTEINSDETKRASFNNKLKQDIKVFDNITVISEGVRDLLEIPKYKSYILPLGAKTLINIEENKELFSNKKLSLLYVGTFKERRIEDTIKAFNKFSKVVQGKDIEYNLIGFFENENQKNNILNLINQNEYQNIKFLGRIPNEELGEYFINSNIGVSYIPITEYFNYQPPTKTYEYLFNGLYTIATETAENIKLIQDKKNGVLIKDNENSFYLALEQIYFNRPTANREEIIETVKEYNWKSICNHLDNYFQKVIKD